MKEMDRYQHVDNIGKGSFGVITRVRRAEDGKVDTQVSDDAAH